MIEIAKLLHRRDAVVSEQNIEELFHFLSAIYEQCPRPEDIVFICIGTDQSTGDSFGPLMGSMLTRMGFPYVIGTLAYPCDAYRVEAEIKSLQQQSKLVIAIDACLGKPKQVGQFILLNGPLLPGAATGKRLSAVGDYSIAAVVNEFGPKAYWKIQNASLYVVMELVEVLSAHIAQLWGMNKEDCHET